MRIASLFFVPVVALKVSMRRSVSASVIVGVASPRPASINASNVTSPASPRRT
jgi:hypothetical protein